MDARSLFAFLAAGALAVACSDPTSPAMRRLAGTYEAARGAAGVAPLVIDFVPGSRRVVALGGG